MSAHLSSSARRTEARPVGYRSLASERCFRATSRRRTTLRSPNSRLGRGNVDRHRDRDNDDEIVHALAVHRAECADDQLCERGQERTRQEQPKSRSAPPRHPRTGPRKLEAKSRILFKLPHAERFSNDETCRSIDAHPARAGHRSRNDPRRHSSSTDRSGFIKSSAPLPLAAVYGPSTARRSTESSDQADLKCVVGSMRHASGRILVEPDRTAGPVSPRAPGQVRSTASPCSTEERTCKSSPCLWDSSACGGSPDRDAAESVSFEGGHHFHDHRRELVQHLPELPNPDNGEFVVPTLFEAPFVSGARGHAVPGNTSDADALERTARLAGTVDRIVWRRAAKRSGAPLTVGNAMGRHCHVRKPTRSVFAPSDAVLPRTIGVVLSVGSAATCCGPLAGKTGPDPLERRSRAAGVCTHWHTVSPRVPESPKRIKQFAYAMATPLRSLRDNWCCISTALRCTPSMRAPFISTRASHALAPVPWWRSILTPPEGAGNTAR